MGFVILIIAVVIAVCILAIYNSNKKNDTEYENNDENHEEIQTQCHVCGKPANGNAVCDDCWERSKVLKRELPYKQTNTYENIIQYRQELMLKIVYPETRFERETNSIKLISISEILYDKYHDSDAYQYTYKFLRYVIEDTNPEEIIDIFGLKKSNVQQKTQTNNQSQIIDYRLQYPKPYRCKDGDYVRSKAEREIDDFLFDNRIWHIYEHEYKHPYSGKTAETDFYLPDYNLYIEYFGMSDDEYIKRRNEKIEMYNSDTSINFEYLTFKDDNDIYKKLKDICFKYDIPQK